MRFLTVTLYFILAIVLFASFGVSLPYIFETFKDGKHSVESTVQNIVTYYIAILASSSLDIILLYIDRSLRHKKFIILLVILANVIAFCLTGFALYENSKGKYTTVPAFLLLGILFSYLIWWCAHYKDEAFNPTSSLGGNPENSLSNG